MTTLALVANDSDQHRTLTVAAATARVAGSDVNVAARQLRNMRAQRRELERAAKALRAYGIRYDERDVVDALRYVASTEANAAENLAEAKQALSDAHASIVHAVLMAY